jgi:hypothetical protein
MRIGPFSVLIVASGIGLSACTTTRGPQPIVSSTGVVANASTTGVAAIFIRSEQASFALPPDNDLATAMMTNGFGLIYASCSDFFQSAGQSQKWLIVSRDAVGAIGTLTAGLMALHDYSQTAVANVALGTGAAFAGLDIYTKNFLFGAENIESVRELTLNALSAHSEKVKSLVSVVTYQSATTYLLDNQEICSPMKISALARQAISRGKVVATTDELASPPVAAPAPAPASPPAAAPAPAAGAVAGRPVLPSPRISVRIQ